MTTASLLWGIVFGSIGAGYCLYGRRQRALAPFVCGIALMVMPYLIANAYLLVPVCLAIGAVPIYLRE